jgi:type I restriction enzyme, S subunit
MKQYPKMKDSGVEWIGDIPEEWQIQKLKFLGDAIIGIIYEPSEIVDNQNGTLVLRASNIQNSLLSMNDCVYVDKNIPEKFRVKKDDILICSRNGSKHLVGKNLMINEKLSGSTFGAFMTVYRSKYANFISKTLNSQLFKSQTGLYSTTTINQLTTSILNNIVVAFPKNEIERNQISEFLDFQTSKIDSEIQKNEKLVTLLQEKKQATINHAVTKGLDDSAPMKDSGVEWIGEIPKHWDIIKIGRLFQNQTIKEIQDGNHGELHPIGEDFIQDGIPFLTADKIRNCKINFNNCKKLSKKFISTLRIGFSKPDDIILTHKGTLGLVTIIPKEQNVVILSPQTTYYRLSKNFIKEYFSFNLQSSLLQEQMKMIGKQSTRYYVGIIEQRNLAIIWTKNIEEQKQIAEFLNKQTKQFDELISKAELQIKTLQEYRQSLISSAITGKIDVREAIA